jgi:hypothetical protein
LVLSIEVIELKRRFSITNYRSLRRKIYTAARRISPKKTWVLGLDSNQNPKNQTPNPNQKPKTPKKTSSKPKNPKSKNSKIVGFLKYLFYIKIF